MSEQQSPWADPLKTAVSRINTPVAIVVAVCLVLAVAIYAAGWSPNAAAWLEAVGRTDAR